MKNTAAVDDTIAFAVSDLVADCSIHFVEPNQLPFDTWRDDLHHETLIKAAGDLMPICVFEQKSVKPHEPLSGGGRRRQ